MSNKQAKQLGKLIRERRLELGYSIRQLAEEIGVKDTTVLRIERGERAAPSPETLTLLAEALEVPLADVYSAIGYTVPTELPSPTLYLRAKFRDLPSGELARVTREVEAVLKRHGIEPGRGDKPMAKSRPSKKGGRR